MTEAGSTQDSPAPAGIKIHAQNLHKAFDRKTVLRGMSLDLVEGETHVILGRSGTGKSVFLKLLTGLMLPDEGWIEVDGERLEGKRAIERIRRQVQMLFQGAALFDSMTVADNIALRALEHKELKPAEVSDFAEKFLELVDLSGSGDKMPSELSGGMKKRAALARALAANPKIMLYDEPTTGLDPLTSQVINQLIRATQERFKVTSVVVTHDLRSAMEVGDRCSFLHDGKILHTCKPSELAEAPHEMIRQFVNDAVVHG